MLETRLEGRALAPTLLAPTLRWHPNNTLGLLGGTRIYLITDAVLPAPALLERTEAALSAVPPDRVALQLRRPGAQTAELMALGRALGPLCRRRGVRLLINHRIDVALALGADGVHLPRLGPSGAEARGLLGEGALIGRSCHDAQALSKAAVEGMDFVTLSPYGSVPGKGPALGPERFSALMDSTALPVFALGGIGVSDLPCLAQFGVQGIALIRGIYRADDSGAAMVQLLDAWPNLP